MDVALNCGVELVDRAFVELGAILLHPGFELAIGRLALFDVVDHGIAVEAETVNDHLVVAFACARIARGEFADGLKREFEPKARKV